jgi:translocation and assembly module TamB
MRAALILCLACLPLGALAQDETQLTPAEREDRGTIVAFIEDNLSSAGRDVVLRGFEGALSSKATATQLTIADSQGIWLTVNDITLDWNRSSLLRGVVSVTDFTAAEIIVARAPVADPTLPTPEAQGFSLPDLPVSIEIDKIAAGRVVLGESLLGQPVEGTIAASLNLGGGQGDAMLSIARTGGGPSGTVDLTADYANEDRLLTLSLNVVEDANGILSSLLNLPGQPSVNLTVDGDGPLSDFAAKLDLKTDGAERLTGNLTVTGDTTTGATRFATSISGDLASLFVPEYGGFFGNSVSLQVRGERATSGQLDVSTLSLAAASARLNGSAMIAPDGLPLAFSLQGALGDPAGGRVVLPGAGAQVSLQSADIDIGFDATTDEAWRATITARDVATPQGRFASLDLTGAGRIARTGAGRLVDGTIKAQTSGVTLVDPGLAQAAGAMQSLKSGFSWSEGSGELRIDDFDLAAGGLRAQASGTISGLQSALRIMGQAEVQAADLTRFSALATRPLGGAATISLQGQGSPLGGDFDLTARVQGTDLVVGLDEVDNLLRGPSTISAHVIRGATGTEVRSFAIDAGTLTASGNGTIATAVTDLKLQFTMTDLGVLGPDFRGRAQGQAQVSGSIATSEAQVTASVNGTDLGVGIPEVDRILGGTSTLNAELRYQDGAVRVDDLQVQTPHLTLGATGRVAGGQRDIDLTARLANLGLVLPEFPGPVTVQGTASETGDGYQLNLSGTGPGQISARVNGTLAPNLRRANLQITGTAQAGLANPFLGSRVVSGPVAINLGLNGPLALGSLTGTVSLSQGRLADPALPFTVQGLNARATLSGGRAQVDVTAGVSTGGSVVAAGTIGLTAPFNGDLTIGLQSVVLRDPQLYETRANGQLRLIGPLTGGAVIAGRIALPETEIRVSSTGLGGATSLEGLTHINEPAPVRETRRRAGIVASGSDGRTPPARAFDLNIVISAPNRVFIRGRGLDAELGGEVLLTGTTRNVIPSGAFNLIRGRLDILGQRITLTQASLQLEGDFDPTIYVVASTTTNGITASVIVSGSVSDPEVTFSSNPELPEEEVLAQLLFGRQLDQLSAFQALQLANAVATLAGRGGDGIVSRLRQGFGLDDLDVQTDAAGNAQLRAGKYLSENLYSEVVVDQTGKSQINLNLDVTDHLTVKGGIGADGNTGLGLFYERDY